MPAVVRRPMWRIWHHLLIKYDKRVSANFMNYGYAPLTPEDAVKLQPKDENSRYCIQLYDFVARPASLTNKKVLEVGSGRGGGADYLTRYHNPESYSAIDISKGIIDFCNSYYNDSRLNFKVGVAEQIPYEKDTFDVVVNVESARCYRDLNVFFNEVHRVLKPGGKFMFADMIEKEEVDEIKQKLAQCNFDIVEETEITPNVVKALDADSGRREGLIKSLAPGFLQSAFAQFAGVKGTERYDAFATGKFRYMAYHLDLKK